MNIAALCKDLRDTSARFGGIKHYLSAADELDRAISAFFKEQDADTLKVLVGAYARASRLGSEVGFVSAKAVTEDGA